MKQYDFLIIGGDAAGLSAAVQIRTHQKDKTIGILEKSNIISYGACGLPYVIGGDIPEFKNLIHYSPEKFSTTYKCDLYTATEAIGIDFQKKSVMSKTANEDKEFAYDQLLIATGAAPIQLPGFDYDNKTVFELKTIPDGDSLLQKLREQNTAHVTLIGAGYIGMELAEALVAIGKKVTVLDMAIRPVDRMPAKIGKKILNLMEDHGIEFLPETTVQKQIKTPGGLELITSHGSIHTNAVVIAVGIRPSTSFLNNSGLEMNKGAILIDKSCRTNIKDVYAAGDCAMVHHVLLEKNVYIPLGSTANKQGRIAGLNMAGVQIEFPGIIGTRIFSFFRHVFAATGLSEEDAKSAGYDPVTVNASRNSRAGYYPGGDKLDVSLVVDKNSGIILGGYLYGPQESAAMIDTIGVMAQMKMKAEDAGWFDAAYAPPIAPVWNAVISAAGKFSSSN